MALLDSLSGSLSSAISLSIPAGGEAVGDLVTHTRTAVVASAATSTAALQTKYQWLFNQISQASRNGLPSTQAVVAAADYTALNALLVSKGYVVAESDVTAQHIMPDSTSQTPDLQSTTQSLITVTWAVINGLAVTPAAQPITAAASSTVTALTGLNLTSFNAVQGTLLVVRFVPSGGQAPYWFTVSGTTPPGLTWSTTSRVSSLTLQGTPTTPAIEYATLTISVVDSTGQQTSQDISWNIAPSAKNAALLI